MAYAMKLETAIVVPGEYTFSNFRRAMGVTALRPGAAAMECKVLFISKLYVGALCALEREIRVRPVNYQMA